MTPGERAAIPRAGGRAPGAAFALAGLVLAACGGSTNPPVVDLAPAEATPPQLVPPREAVETARTIDLTGSEMGTMWTFEGAPLDRWEEAYGFRPSASWLEHARLSSLRYGEFCSASFVSPRGLVMTNHHCARSCVDAVGGAGEDLLGDGFLAGAPHEERRCPGLHLDQLVAVTDVTDQLTADEGDLTPAERAEAVEMLSNDLVEACEHGKRRICQVVSLYHGGRYMLYEYRRYPDVRLVFAPELSIGFYGGDPDNFTYPRYNLDVSFVRAYGPHGRPVESANHFRWDPQGADEGEVVFVTGHPGSTSRQITVSQYMYEREIRHPLLLQFMDQRLDVFRAETDPARARELSNAMFILENSQKLFRGELEGLRSTELLARKIRWERELRDRIAADPATARRFEGLWEDIGAVQAEKAELFPRVTIQSASNQHAAPHLQLAAALNAYVDQMALPADERAAPFAGDAGTILRRRIVDPGPLPVERSVRLLAGRMSIAREWLGPDDPLVAAVRPGESPSVAARRLLTSSRVGDADFRRRALEMSADELSALDDPLLELARRVVRAGDRAHDRWLEAVAREEGLNERLAQAFFVAFGTELPPDATFTLRITDGVVKGYAYNGTRAPAKTTIYGLYGRTADFDGREPWTLPASWIEARDRVEMRTPINFVATTDITGGNSGSPIIDREGRIVGLAFDGNVESFPNEFLFGAPGGRTVAVHSAGILEALRSVYGAERLVRELTGD